MRRKRLSPKDNFVPTCVRQADKLVGCHVPLFHLVGPLSFWWWQAVKAAGPFMVTLGFFVILPLVWQLPICFITAELTTTLQVRLSPLVSL